MMPSRVAARLLLAVRWIFLFIFVFHLGVLHAAISVGPSGTGTLTFDATPPAGEWSTVNLGGGSGDITTVAAMDENVITNMDAAAITTALGTSSTLPISANALARRHSAQNWLQTPPTGVKYTVLMATLQNDSGADLAALDVSYDLGNNLQTGTTAVEEIPGHRVYYSQSGAPGSWLVAAALSGGTVGQVSGTINLGTWAQGAMLYILWIDDNAAADRNNSGNEEGGYTIDNWLAVGVLPPRPKDLVFQQGLDGYTGVQDTYLRFASSDTVFGGAGAILIDLSDGGGEMHGLIRFDNIFGAAMNQIPPGATIRSASLTLNISNVGNDIGVYRMLVPWDQTNSTWNTMVDGVLADGVEAASTPDATTAVSATGLLVIPLSTASLQAWANGAPNYGWALLSTGTDGVDCDSSEVPTVANRPKLMVSWGAAGEPTVKALDGTATGFTLFIEDGNPPGDVNPGTVTATLNGNPITTSASKVGTVTTVTYTSPTLFPAGSTNSLSVTLKHTGTQTLIIDQDYVVPPYTVVSPSLAVTGVDTSKPGFRIYPYQSDGYEVNTTQPNDLTWTEDQVAGLHGANVANLFIADADGSVVESAVINYSGEAYTGTERGNFTSDVYFPGIPGTLGLTGNSTIEAIAFLYFPAPGTYTMGVNSDDGFRVTVGRNPRDRFSTVLGEFDGGRGAADTLFDIVIEQAGYYPCRLLWENGNGELPGNQYSCEWFTVLPDGTKILVNDVANPNSIRAYYSGPLSIFVKYYNPKPNAVDVPLSTTLDFMLGDGSSTTVLGSSIKLWLDGVSVTPVATKPAGTNLTIVTYDPPGDLTPEDTHTLRLEFSDNGAPAYSITNEYQFVTAPTTISLIAIDDATMWRYDQSLTDLGTTWKEKNFNDSAWPLGAALLASESGTTVEPIRTYLTLGTWITYYFRIHFNYSGPSGVRLRLSHIIDDGAVFYLNGVEVHRFGLAEGASFDANTAFASHEGRDHYDGPYLIPTASLVQGDNVLAVEVHQTTTDSSDLVFGAVLDALTSHLARNTIEAVTPAPNATDVPRDSTIGLTIVDGTNAVTSSSVKMWVNGGSVSPTVNKPAGSGVTTVSYNPGTSLPYGLPVNVKVEFADNGPVPNVTTYEWTYNASLETITLFAVDDATQWRYEVTGQDLGTAWVTPGYNDSAWPLGAALLADETGATAEPIRTPFARNGIITFYFRHHFNYTRQLTGITLNLRHVVDDGAVFYLNGTEVFRTDNMPLGTITYLTTAIVDQENAWRGPYQIAATNLVNGENVFAVEVHQNSATSSDVVFGAELKAILLPASEQPRFTSVTLEPGGLRIEWTGAGTLEESDSVTGGWSQSASQANPQVIPTTSPRKFYRISQ